MLSTTPSIRVRSFLQLAPYLAGRGVSSIEFFKRLDISPYVFQNLDGWLPRKQCFQVAGEMVAVTGDPFGRAHVGALTELRSLGTWGRSILASSDIARACALAAANVSMLHQGSDIRFVVEVELREFTSVSLNGASSTLASSSSAASRCCARFRCWLENHPQ